jgi:hypothetical protein
MLGQQFDDGVVGLAIDGPLPHVDRELAVVADLDERAFAAARFGSNANHLPPNVKVCANFREILDNMLTFGEVTGYRATMTEEPWPNRPWLAVTPTVAPSTWRPTAWPFNCQVNSQT